MASTSRFAAAAAGRRSRARSATAIPAACPCSPAPALRDVSVRARPQSARAVATVVISFSDRPQPSIEDDVIYLVPDRGRRWLIAKPSATLYRAVGIADVPPSVLTPPRS